MIGAPWHFYNYQLHQTILLANLATLLLWKGSPEFFQLMNSQETVAQIWQEHLNPNNNGNHHPFTVAGMTCFGGKALASILSEPDTYVSYMVLKPLLFWTGHPTVDWPNYNFFKVEALAPYFSLPRILGVFASRIFPLVALFALIIINVVHSRIRDFSPLLLIMGCIMVLYTLTYPEMRYSEPLYPILAIFVVAVLEPQAVRRTSRQNYRRHHRYA